MGSVAHQKITKFWTLAVLALLFFSCASHVQKQAPVTEILTEKQLLKILDENRFSRFYYSDNKIFSGIMLRWMPDSVYIQPRGTSSPIAIPTAGMARIETTVGNKMLTGLAIGAMAAGAYFVAVKGYDLKSVTFLEGLAKLLVPPVMVLTAMGIGASKEIYESYIVPPGFEFNYDLSKVRLQRGK